MSAVTQYTNWVEQQTCSPVIWDEKLNSPARQDTPIHEFHETCHSVTFYYPRQELLSGIVVSGKKLCPSGGRMGGQAEIGRMGGRAARRHAFVSGPLCKDY